MNDKLIKLAERRKYLITQAATQRSMLAHNTEPWRSKLLLADQGIAGLSYIKRHPAVFIGAGVAMLVVLRNNMLLKWLRRGWLTWRVISKLR